MEELYVEIQVTPVALTEHHVTFAISVHDSDGQVVFYEHRTLENKDTVAIRLPLAPEIALD